MVYWVDELCLFKQVGYFFPNERCNGLKKFQMTLEIVAYSLLIISMFFFWLIENNSLGNLLSNTAQVHFIYLKLNH